MPIPAIVSLILTVAGSAIPAFVKALRARKQPEAKVKSLPLAHDIRMYKIETPGPRPVAFMMKITPTVLAFAGLLVALIAGLQVYGEPLSALRGLLQREFFYQLLFLVGLVASFLLTRRAATAFVQGLDSSGKVLLGFGLIVIYFAGSAIIHYWKYISVSVDQFYLGSGLFLAMIAGMFVQVITANYKAATGGLLAVTPAQLIYPVLFSPIVYYAIWSVASVPGTARLFSLYAAFLNGYFWQSVVSSAETAKKSAVRPEVRAP